jgi:hypothetical protein
MFARCNARPEVNVPCPARLEGPGLVRIGEGRLAAGDAPRRRGLAQVQEAAAPKLSPAQQAELRDLGAQVRAVRMPRQRGSDIPIRQVGQRRLPHPDRLLRG